MKNIWNVYCNFQYLSELLDYREDIVFSVMFEAGNSHQIVWPTGLRGRRFAIAFFSYCYYFLLEILQDVYRIGMFVKIKL